MTRQSVFSVVVDPERNLAHTQFTGSFTAAAMQDAAAQVQALLPQLKPGFSILADLSQVVAMDLDCVPPLTRIMDLCREHGVGLIVRMLPAKEHDIGINLLSLIHYRGKVTIVTVDTMAEAEQALR